MNAQIQSTPGLEDDWNAKYAAMELKLAVNNMLRHVSDVSKRLRRTANDVDQIAERLANAINDEERRKYQTILEQSLEVQGQVLNSISNMRFDLIAKYAASVTNNLERSTNKE